MAGQDPGKAEDMKTRLRATRGRIWGRAGLFGAVLALGACAVASAATPITVSLGAAAANIGDTAEMPVSIQAGDSAPATLLLFLRYDPSKIAPNTAFYQAALRSLSGPVLDEHGNPVISTSAVRAESTVGAAQKIVDSEVYPEGVLAIGVTGMNTLSLGDGLTLTVAFKVLPDAQENEYLPVTGLDATQPALALANGPALSSGSSAAAAPLGLSFQNGAVHVGCTSIETPANVSATQGQASGVSVTWTAVADPHAEYQVLRSSDPNPATAAALGGWQSGVSFEDTTAAAPVQTDPGGCFRNPSYDFVRYYYWVKSRNLRLCESGFSTPPAEGYRGTGKAARAGDAVLTAGLLLLMGFGRGLKRRRARSQG